MVADVISDAVFDQSATKTPIIEHKVKQFVREKVGIPEGEPAALMVHVTRGGLGYDIYKHGFVNVSGRGTLAPIIDNFNPAVSTGVPSIVVKAGEMRGSDNVMIIFCVPAERLKLDKIGKYGYWYDNNLPEGKDQVLEEVYKGIVMKYDGETGNPVEYAKDDPELYPVWIPPQYIYDVIYPEKFTGKRAE